MGCPYTLVLTHDVDIWLLSQVRPKWRVLCGFIFRTILHNAIRTITGRLSVRLYLRGVLAGLLAPLAYLGLSSDPLKGMIEFVRQLEERLDVRSTFFFVPRHSDPGYQPNSKRAPRVRAVFYPLQEMAPLIRRLARGGWEIGVHGIDAYYEPEAARREFRSLSEILRRGRIGHRSHWLYSKGRESWITLHKAGFAYDASYGWNDKIGWPGARRYPFRPLNNTTFTVLPLNIQDKAIMDRPFRLAWKAVRNLLTDAKKKGGVVTVLWHVSNFGPPRYWGDFYERMILQAKADGARIAIAEEAVLYWVNDDTEKPQESQGGDLFHCPPRH